MLAQDDQVINEMCAKIYFFENNNILRHLELVIALAIPVSNEWKIVSDNWAAQRVPQRICILRYVSPDRQNSVFFLFLDCCFKFVSDIFFIWYFLFFTQKASITSEKIEKSPFMGFGE